MTTFTQQGSKLVGTGSTGTQGYSVSVYENTMVEGSINDGGGVGATWVFTRDSAGVWTQQQKLIGSGNIGNSSQGISVSLYQNTLAVGGYTDNTNVGAVWVFTRDSTGVWTQQQKLIGIGGVGSANQGNSVSVFQDTLVIGGSNDNGGIGAVWIFTRTAGVWTQQQYINPGGIVGIQFGSSVSLYNYTLAVGAASDDPTGSVFMYVLYGTTWTQQGSKLIGTGSVGTPGQGGSVSLYQDTVITGGPFDNSNIGATWVFTRAGTTWTQQGSKIVGTGYANVNNVFQGSSVSIYENTIVIGGTGSDTNVGAAWVFKYNGNWSQAQKLVGTSPVGQSQQGYSVSINQGTIAVGGIGDNTNAGALWMFFNNLSVFTDYNNILVPKINTIIPQTHESRHTASGDDPLTLSNGTFWIGNSSNQIAENTMSGAATMTSTGVLTLGITPIALTYLVVAGGGGGGSVTSGNGGGGGGGAGGVISSSQTVAMTTSSVALTITVGTGGAGGTGVGGGVGTSGNNSVISGTGFTTATAIGGGGGGGNNGSLTDGLSGGSGGGGSSTKLGGSGTASQGNAGGNGANGPVNSSGAGGGGGAGAVGANADAFGDGGNGGNGIANSITGVSVTYAGGGGGSAVSTGTPGSGGTGGGGGASSTAPVAGTNGLGGGGGAGLTVSGAAGGSGIVILAVPTQYYGSFTGTATTTLSGSNTIISFTTSGTLTLVTIAGTYNTYGYTPASTGLITSVSNNLIMYCLFDTFTARTAIGTTSGGGAYQKIDNTYFELTTNTTGIIPSNVTTTTTEADIYIVSTQLPSAVSAFADFVLAVLLGSEYIVLNVVAAFSGGGGQSTSNSGIYLLPVSTLLTMYYFTTLAGNTTMNTNPYGGFFNTFKLKSDIYTINYGSVATSITDATNVGITNSTLTTSTRTSGISVSGGIVTVSITGFYVIHYQLSVARAGGVKEIYVKWTKAAGGTERIVFNCIGATNSLNPSISASGVHYISSGDTLQLFIRTNTGVTTNLATSINSKTINTYFNVARIVPSIYVYYYGNVSTSLANAANGNNITESTLTNKFKSAGITAVNGLITINIPGSYLLYNQAITNTSTYYETWFTPNGNLSSIRYCHYISSNNGGITEGTTINNSNACLQVANISTSTTLQLNVYQADGSSRTLNPTTSLGGDTINTYVVVIKLH